MNFILFSGWDYYPCGGANDISGHFDSVDAAMEHYKKVKEKNRYECESLWAHIYSLKDLRIVKSLERYERVEGKLARCPGYWVDGSDLLWGR